MFDKSLFRWGVFAIALLSAAAAQAETPALVPDPTVPPPPVILVPPVPIDGPGLLALVNSARSGNSADEGELGERYYSGRGLPQDYDKAQAWLRKAAGQGDNFSQFILGIMYLNGKGVAQDDIKARAWFQKAADQGYGLAQDHLGAMDEKGLGGTTDPVQAYTWYTLATLAKTGQVFGDDYVKDRDALAATMTASQIAEAQARVKAWQPVPPTKDQQVQAGVKAVERRQYNDALQILTPLATDGNPVAQAWLGAMYHSGMGVPQNDETALSWLQKAAGNGDAFGELHLASLYYSGHGVSRDYAEAAKWNRKAADQGLSFAQFGLGMQYLLGKGADQDWATAGIWMKKAAAQGDCRAQYFLSILYATGQGAPKDAVQAYQWATLSTLYATNATEKDTMTTQQSDIAKRLDTMQVDAANAAVKKWQPVFPGPDGQ